MPTDAENKTKELQKAIKVRAKELLVSLYGADSNVPAGDFELVETAMMAGANLAMAHVERQLQSILGNKSQ